MTGQDSNLGFLFALRWLSGFQMWSWGSCFPSLGSLLEMQILSPRSRSAGSETLGTGPSNLYLNTSLGNSDAHKVSEPLLRDMAD